MNKRDTLTNIIRACGLAASQGVHKLRIILKSLKAFKLPIRDAEVHQQLQELNEATSGNYSPCIIIVIYLMIAARAQPYFALNL